MCGEIGNRRKIHRAAKHRFPVAPVARGKPERAVEKGNAVRLPVLRRGRLGLLQQAAGCDKACRYKGSLVPSSPARRGSACLYINISIDDLMMQFKPMKII